jgi:quercetin dioxygenase-like cupin family protein
MHHVRRRDEVTLTSAYPGQSRCYSRAPLVDRSVGSVHMEFGLCALAAGGHINRHVHSFEESFYVLEGSPVLVMDNSAYSLSPGTCGVVPVGIPHAWLGAPREAATWIDMLSPQPRTNGAPADTFFIDAAAAPEYRELDIRDPRSRHLFRMSDRDIDLDTIKSGTPADAPIVSASMNTALLAYSGIALKMLVDQRLGAELSSMFMVEYQPGGVAHPHDHPLEEAYFMLEGEVDAMADDRHYVLGPGDVFWTGVGCIHSFENRSGARVRWLETQSPQLPARYGYRFNRDWEYLKRKLSSEAPRIVPDVVR